MIKALKLYEAVFLNLKLKTYCLLLFFAFVPAAIIFAFSPNLYNDTITGDTFLELDAGLKVFQGLIPNVDFSSPIGPLFSLINAAAMSFVDDVRALIAAKIFMAAFFLLICGYAAFKRIKGVNALLIPIYTAFFVMSPIYLDNFKQISFFMSYSLYAQGCFAVALIFLFFPTVYKNQLELILDSIILGLLIFLTIYIKFNYGGLLLAALVVHHFITPKDSRLTCGAFGIILLAVCFVEFIFHLNIPYAKDLLNAMKATQNSDFFGKNSFILNFIDVFYYNKYLIIFLLITYFFTRKTLFNGENKDKIRKSVSFLFLIFAPVIALCFDYNQFLTLFPIAFIFIINENIKNNNKIFVPQILIFIAMTTVIVIGYFGIIKHFYMAFNQNNTIKIENNPKSPINKYLISHKYLAPSCDDFNKKAKAIRVAFGLDNIKSSDFFIDNMFWGHINKFIKYYEPCLYFMAKDIINPYIDNNKTIFNFSFVNPYPYQFNMKSPRNTMIGWHFERAFNNDSAISPEKLFSDIDIIVRPLIITYTEAALINLYEQYIIKNYIKANENEAFRIYIKK